MKVLAVFAISWFVLLAGCLSEPSDAQSQLATEMIKKTPEFRALLEAYPGATIVVVYLGVDKVAAQLSTIEATCNTSVSVRPLYRVTVDTTDFSGVAYVDERLQKPECVVVKNKFLPTIAPESPAVTTAPPTPASLPVPTIAASPSGVKPFLLVFAMSFCPYCHQLEKELGELVKQEGDKFSWESHYVIYDGVGSDDVCGRIGNSSFCAMHGIRELGENFRRICIRKVYEDKFFDYVNRVNSRCTLDNVETCSREAADALGIKPDSLRSCFESSSVESLLREEVNLLRKYDVSGAPTIFINGVQYNGPRTKEALAAALSAAALDESGSQKPSIVSCVDSDGPENFAVKGFIELTYSDGSKKVLEDSCGRSSGSGEFGAQDYFCGFTNENGVQRPHYWTALRPCASCVDGLCPSNTPTPIIPSATPVPTSVMTVENKSCVLSPPWPDYPIKERRKGVCRMPDEIVALVGKNGTVLNGNGCSYTLFFKSSEYKRIYVDGGYVFVTESEFTLKYDDNHTEDIGFRSNGTVVLPDELNTISLEAQAPEQATVRIKPVDEKDARASVDKEIYAPDELVNLSVFLPYYAEACAYEIVSPSSRVSCLGVWGCGPSLSYYVVNLTAFDTVARLWPGGKTSSFLARYYLDNEYGVWQVTVTPYQRGVAKDSQSVFFRYAQG